MKRIYPEHGKMDTKCFLLLLWSYFPNPRYFIHKNKKYIWNNRKTCSYANWNILFPAEFSLYVYIFLFVSYFFIQLLWPNLKKFSFHIKKKQQQQKKLCYWFASFLLFVFLFLFLFLGSIKKNREGKLYFSSCAEMSQNTLCIITLLMFNNFNVYWSFFFVAIKIYCKYYVLHVPIFCCCCCCLHHRKYYAAATNEVYRIMF